MTVTLKEYTREALAGQPIGAWAGMASRLVVGGLREQLAVEGLAQPHWWTLNHVAGSPGVWTRPVLTARLATWDFLGTDFERVYDELVARGWLTEDAGTGAMTLTEEGEEGRVRARDRNARVHRQAHEGVGTDDFVTTINVLRRIVANMGGEGDLPG
ncbi:MULTISPECIES: MarR family transcriptional regulator [unclassified Streptomyces]|uniref:MarR family transcriptional regulator n=1 Tax=unclassified Streptomyces TaxID=2593676 RepID=UPI001660752F|nr:MULTISPECIES: MarR family transcriptional regulator [unclassified Streptomyces]MBD0709069.1 MarR family transcriptional regulator [Streptomyces sp. CBMA291]MBD0716219.1 MarR family transcriptional regulator [Streptomyces sp. CBMA370]